jgi:tetratricopeptide (TPR) repeat protein
MTMEYDLTLYFETLQEMLPGFQGQDLSLPSLGKVKMVLDADNGRASFQSSVKTRDIQTLIAYFKGVPPSEIPLAEAPDTGQAPGEPQEPAPVQKPLDTQKAKASPLLKKGALAALNGDNPSAVTYFNQAIQMAPDNSDAYFQLGVTLGEMGNYPDALDALDRAVSLNPGKGRYVYARGRVYLLSGDRENAMRDFKRAAELGDDDARAYLERAAATVQN